MPRYDANECNNAKDSLPSLIPPKDEHLEQQLAELKRFKDLTFYALATATGAFKKSQHHKQHKPQLLFEHKCKITTTKTTAAPRPVESAKAEKEKRAIISGGGGERLENIATTISTNNINHVSEPDEPLEYFNESILQPFEYHTITTTAASPPAASPGKTTAIAALSSDSEEHTLTQTTAVAALAADHEPTVEETAETASASTSASAAEEVIVIDEDSQATDPIITTVTASVNAHQPLINYDLTDDLAESDSQPSATDSELPHRRRRGRCPGKKIKYLQLKDNSRLLSLRARKPVQVETPKRKTNKKQQQPEQTQQQTQHQHKKHQNYQQQYLQHLTQQQKTTHNNKHQTKAGKGRKQQQNNSTAGKAVILDPFDPLVLNRIDTLEFDVKPVGRKRKRVLSLNIRKRTRTPKAAKVAKEKELLELPLEEIPVIALPAVIAATLPIVATSPSTIIDTTTTEPAEAAAAAAIVTASTTGTVKRQRIMSLYERRFQASNDDARGVNGYLSSRNSSAGSSNTVHTDAISEAQDISNQYYMSASNVSTTSGGNNGGSSIHLNHTPSMATLCNIGNTCYLNSVVYTLRFAPHFLHNLHHLIQDLNSIQQYIGRRRAKSSSLGRGISAGQLENARSWSNKDLVSMEQYNNVAGNVGALGGMANSGSSNGKSTHQLLSEKLHELYASLHRNEALDSTEPYHADTLLHAIQDVSATFEGNQQQDAHEFLMCVLNSIRETCQTLIKSIAECPDLLANGNIANIDETDAIGYVHDKDATASTTLVNANTQLSSIGAGSSSNNGNMLSTTNLSSKTSFFSRKSKRKDEVKSSKSSRLQSPLKDMGILQQHQQSSASNSLFYLNTVDLSGSSVSGSGLGGTLTPPQSNLSSSTSSTASSIKIGDESPSSAANILLDKERLAERIRELGLDFFSEDFEGVTVATTKCLSCETITEQKESMIDIAVPVPISGYDSSDYTEKPSAFIQNSCITREYFRGENKYRCEQCTGYTEAIRSISYEVLPRLLVIQLSRFSGGMEKINSYIPTSFTLQCFCSKCCELSDANKLHIYKLYSVITHVGATMSVGHYIAYTCSLDVANEYANCPKERRNNAHQQQHQQLQQQANLLNGLQANSTTNLTTLTQGAAAGTAAAAGVTAQQNTTTTSSLASSGTSLIKKMKFGRSKASSSGDMSKNMKNLNGITSKTITNGIGKLSMNTTCQSLNCCAMRLCGTNGLGHTGAATLGSGQHLSAQAVGSNSSTSSSGYNSNDYSEETLQNGTNANLNYNSYPSGYGSTGRAGIKNPYASAEPVWYMCDDDKIKAMSQRDFEELLSPARKITITPYLLFYARFDLQPQAAGGNVATTPTSKQAGAAGIPQTSWSTESLHGSGSSASGIVGLHKI